MDIIKNTSFRINSIQRLHAMHIAARYYQWVENLCRFGYKTNYMMMISTPDYFLRYSILHTLIPANLYYNLNSGICLRRPMREYWTLLEAER